MTAQQVAVDVRIPSDVSAIEPVVDLVVQRCRELQFPPRACTLNIPVALSEALSNAIISGNREDGRKHVRIRATVNDRELILEVADEGAGFDLATATHDPTTPELIQREDGRGLFLMRRLMDRVEQFRANGNVVRMVLRR